MWNDGLDGSQARIKIAAEISIASDMWRFPWRGFPDSSAVKESACNEGDPGSISGMGRSSGERIGYPLQYSFWPSLVAQLVKNQPAMQETWVRSLGWGDPPEKGKATHSSYSGLENSLDCIVHGVPKSQTWLSDFHFQTSLFYKFYGKARNYNCQKRT